MKRIYLCLLLTAAIVLLTAYGSGRVQSFAADISAYVDTAVEAIRQEDLPAARRAALAGAALCEEMRLETPLYLRTEDFTELEASLRAADSYLELDTCEEALGELRRAGIQAENLDRLARRWL